MSVGWVVVVVVLCTHVEQLLCFLHSCGTRACKSLWLLQPSDSRPTLQVVSAKAEVPDVCKTPFGDVLVTLFHCWSGLEGEGGGGVCWLLWSLERQWPLVKACEVRSVALKWQLWKHLNPLKEKMGDRRFFVCSFCDEP